MLNITPKFPKKVQFLLELDFSFLDKLIQGKKVALDSSFLKTYSGHEEDGSLGWNGHKEAIGFKLHALIDAQTGVLIALIIGDEVTYDSQVAIPLLKKADHG